MLIRTWHARLQYGGAKRWGSSRKRERLMCRNAARTTGVTARDQRAARAIPDDEHKGALEVKAGLAALSWRSIG